MAEHRVSMLGGPLRRYEDPARSRDPRIRELVAALATVEPAPAPRAHFRAELRAQLVAVAPRIIAESEAERAPAHTAPKRRSAFGSVLSGVKLSRPLAAVACTVVVLAMLLGGAVFVSRNALPGSSWYGFKRASENAQLAVAGSPTKRAELRLDFASTRIGEVQDLIPAPKAGAVDLSSHTASLVNSTLASANSDMIDASQTLGEQAIQDRSSAPLKAITSWAPGQLTRLEAVIVALPPGSVRNNAVYTYSLLQSVLSRATMLSAQAGCTCERNAPSDNLGPIPCPVCSSGPATVTPNGTPSTTVPGTGTNTPTNSANPSGSTAGGSVGGNSGIGGIITGGTGSGGTTQPSGGGASSTPGNPLKSIIPTGLPTVSVPPISVGPIGVGPSCISVSLSPINLHLCAPSK